MRFKVKKKPGTPGWSLRVYISQKEQARYVPQESWPPGLSSTMSIDQAREVIKSLNAVEDVRQAEISKANIHTRLRFAAAKECAWLPEDVVSHFERIYIETKRQTPGFPKLASIWLLVQKLILEVNLDPQDWALEPLPIWSWWKKNPSSQDYIARVTRLMNKYGHLYCRKYGKPFSPIERLPHSVWVEMEDSVTSRKSDKLTEDALADLKSKLPPSEYSWVAVAWGFGLRPEECDLISAPQSATRPSWWLEGETLVIDQPKLKKVPKRERYKRIPAFTEFQKECLELIRAGNLKRPSVRMTRRLFPEGVTLYGCRHGFTQHMEILGQPFESISKWLGHRSRATTEKYYRDHGLLAKHAA